MKRKCVVVRCACGRRSFGDVAIGVKRLEVTMPLSVVNLPSLGTNLIEKPNDVGASDTKPWTSPAKACRVFFGGVCWLWVFRGPMPE